MERDRIQEHKIRNRKIKEHKNRNEKKQKNI